MLIMKELQLDITKPQPRNTLPDKTAQGMEVILSKLWNGKAISWDGVTDSIFRKEFNDHIAEIVKDLWSSSQTNTLSHVSYL